MLSATSAFLPRSIANERILAMRSFTTFLSISLSSIFLPPPVTGWDAPMFVSGAIAATCAACTMNAPADAARAPDGATHTTTGISESAMRDIMCDMESTRPPGVSILKTRIALLSPLISSRTLSTYSSIGTPTTPVIGAKYTTVVPLSAPSSPDPAAEAANRDRAIKKSAAIFPLILSTSQPFDSGRTPLLYSIRKLFANFASFANFESLANLISSARHAGKIFPARLSRCF